jgi:hypothetical protein
MDTLIIEPTLNSPRVVLDPQENRFEFSGESRPENVRNFYLPVLEWLEEFSNSASGSCTFVFNFEYFNSTSAKYILDVFKILHTISQKGTRIEVKWHYEEDDEDMYEVGQEMSRMSGLDFEYVVEDV